MQNGHRMCKISQKLFMKLLLHLHLTFCNRLMLKDQHYIGLIPCISWKDKKSVQGLWKKRTVSINFSCCPWALKCPPISSLSLRTCGNLPAACTNTDTNGWPALASAVGGSCSIWCVCVCECIVTVTTAHLKSSLSYLTSGSPRGVAHNVIVWRLEVSGSEIKWFRMKMHLCPRGQSRVTKAKPWRTRDNEGGWDAVPYTKVLWC